MARAVGGRDGPRSAERQFADSPARDKGCRNGFAGMWQRCTFQGAWPAKSG